MTPRSGRRWAEELAVLGSALLIGILVPMSAAYRADGWPVTRVWMLAVATTAVLLPSRFAIGFAWIVTVIWLWAVRGWSNLVLVAAVLLLWAVFSRWWLRQGWSAQSQWRRACAAGVATIAIGSAFWIHQTWPWWFGEDVYLVATVNGYGPNRLRLEFKDAQVWLRGVAEPSQWALDFFTPVTPLPGIWDTSKPWPLVAKRLLGRRLFLQMERSGRPLPDGSHMSTAVSLSEAPVEGFPNFAVRVISAWPTHEGMLSLNFASAPLEPWLHGSVVPRDGPEVSRAAVRLRVLPSGRYAVIGIVRP